jgi:DNA-binding NarL/FixJ family response regulator
MRSEKPRVVVAEDHRDMREMIVKILQRDFDVVTSVKTGPAAIEATNSLNPDVLVVDVRMHGLDGADVVKRLMDLGSKAKIVFVSVSMDPAQIALCLAARGAACVSKMRMASELTVAVRKVLSGEMFVSVM